MERVYMERRLTHRYVGTYSHLDRWADVSPQPARLTPARMVEESNGYDDGGTYHRWATLPVGVDRSAAVRALEDTLSRQGCAHEYDCCGCVSFSTRVKHRHGRRVLLVTRVSANY